MSITLVLIIISVAASFYAWNNSDVYSKWMFNPYMISKKHQYYRFLTSGFIHADYMHLFFNMMSLYFIGDALEYYFYAIFGVEGKYYFIALYLLGIVAADITTYIKQRNNYNYNSLGASGAVSAVIFSFILFDPTNMLRINFIPMPAFIFGIVYLGISYYQANRAQDNINHDAHFYGALFGVVFTGLVHPISLVNFFHQIANWRLF